MNTTKIGTAGEDAAANYLMRKGYRIAERNYKCKVAEIDIIAYNNDDTICFIEVKTRKNFQFGYPSEFVDSRKQHKIHLGAMSYINKKQIDKQIRFDVIEVYASITGDLIKITGINHIENAF